LGWQYGQTADGRRVYMRWGKQAYEIGRWITDFGGSITSKMGITLKIAMEQLLGKKALDWPTPWMGGYGREKVFGAFQVEGRFWDSRAGHLLAKVVPMSIMTTIQGRPTTFFAPTKLGTSKYVAHKKLHQLLYAYADSEVAEHRTRHPEAERAMRAMSEEILRAVELNGFPRDDVLKTAKTMARTRYYTDIYAELRRKKGPREKELQKITESLKRLGGSLKQLTRSVKSKGAGKGHLFERKVYVDLRKVWRDEPLEEYDQD
jgi:IS5 family transposase